MTIKDKLLQRGQSRPRRVIEVETRDGDVLSFNVPHTGLERAEWRRGRAEFIESHQNAPQIALWASKGLMPAGGYPVEELGLVFDLHSMNTEGWSQQDVLELMRDNYDEVIAIGAKLSQGLVEAITAIGAEEIAEKKVPSSPEVQSIGSTEPA